MKLVADFAVGFALAATFSAVPALAQAPVASSGANLSAIPTSGRAPLTVSFRAEGPPHASVGSAIDFGDGSASILQPAPVCFGCNSLAISRHTYASAGTY